MPQPSTTADLFAAIWFMVAWLGYGLALESPRLNARSLNGRMDAFRLLWMERMADRDLRIVDTAIMASLQNGSAFFASTSLIALGGSLSLLRSPDDALQVFSALPVSAAMTRGGWEIRIVGLAVIFAYAFFKFAWSFRLMNYTAILIGATPFRAGDPQTLAMAHRAAAMSALSGAHFNRGQRAFFFAVGYLGWFVGPYVFMATTAGVLVVMCRRQFGRLSLNALKGASPP